MIEPAAHPALASRKRGKALTRAAFILLIANEIRGLVTVALLGPSLLDWLR